MNAAFKREQWRMYSHIAECEQGRPQVNVRASEKRKLVFGLFRALEVFETKSQRPQVNTLSLADGAKLRRTSMEMQISVPIGTHLT